MQRTGHRPSAPPASSTVPARMSRPLVPEEFTSLTAPRLMLALVPPVPSSRVVVSQPDADSGLSCLVLLSWAKYLGARQAKQDTPGITKVTDGAAIGDSLLRCLQVENGQPPSLRFEGRAVYPQQILVGAGCVR